jgi:hypothetical protein
MNPALTHAVDATMTAYGFAPCYAGGVECVHFEIGDINALEAEVYNDAPSILIGARCDTPAGQIPRDASGRITREGCDGVNAGSLLLVASSLGKRKLPFAMEAQNDTNTDQIWNQPAYQFQLHRLATLTEAQAANLVVHGTLTGDQTHYAWDAQARGWALADFSIFWVSEYGPNQTVIPGSYSTRETRMVAVIELSSPATDPQTMVLGGEFINDPTVSATRLTVASYLWMPTGAGPEQAPLTDDSNHHNPYVRPSLVAQLVALGR